MKTYIVKCRTHFPGFEIFSADDEEQALRECLSWKGCLIEDTDTLHEYLPNLVQERLLTEEWTNSFEERIEP